MLGQVKRNKTYYGFLLGNALYSSVMTVLTLSLINPPIALAAAALNFVANMTGGIFMGKRYLSQEGAPEEKAAADKNAAAAPKGFFKQAKSFVKSTFNYFVTTLKNPNFVVGSSSAGAGINIFFQAALGIHSILTTHSLLFLSGISGLAAVGGIAACVAVAGAAVFCAFAGTQEEWKAISRFFSPRRKDGSGAAQNNNASPQSWTAKLANNRLVKTLKKPLMIVMSSESNIFALIASSTALVRHAGAMFAGPQAIMANIIPTLIAVNWATSPVWNLISTVRLIVHDLFRKGGSKSENLKQVAKDLASVCDPAPEPANSALPTQSIKEEFDKTAGKAAGKDTSPKEPSAPAPNQKPKL